MRFCSCWLFSCVTRIVCILLQHEGKIPKKQNFQYSFLMRMVVIARLSVNIILLVKCGAHFCWWLSAPEKKNLFHRVIFFVCSFLYNCQWMLSCPMCTRLQSTLAQLCNTHVDDMQIYTQFISSTLSVSYSVQLFGRSNPGSHRSVLRCCQGVNMNPTTE